MPDLIGRTLGTYRIVEQIGLGGMATVYKAYQPSMDRYVALKVLSTHLAQDTTFVKRFQQEAKVIAKLEHLHILPVYDHGEEDSYLYLVMRFIEAGTLKDRLEKGPLSLDEARRIVAQVGSALEYAHQLGVVHRDIKPSNVLITPQGDYYLTDFGIAKMVEGTLGLTGSGVIGTPHYMAPEQSQSLKVDHRADVYAMGVVIYEMVTGQVPFDAETPFAVVMKHVTEPLPLPRNIRPDLPEAVERVILRALAKDPADRYQSMRDLVTGFDQAVSGAPARARAAVTPPRATQLPTLVEEGEAEPTAVVPGPATASIPAWRRWVAGQPPWLLPAAGLALIVLVLAGLIVSQIPGRVEISGGQVQVVLPTTPAAQAAEAQAETPASKETASDLSAAAPTTAPPTSVPATSTPAPTAIPKPSAQQHADLANTYMARWRWDEALAEIGQAIELDPANAQYYMTRAWIYDEGKGMMDQAVADATRAVELAPTLYDAWATRGGVYLHMGKCDLSAADQNRAIQLDPQRFEGYVNRADALSCQGKLDQAIADYSHGLEVDPTSSWAHWTRGMTYEQKGDLAAALADYSQAIQLNPADARDGPSWYLSRAGAYRAQGQHDQALADCAAILALLPNDPRGFYCRGMSEAALGQTDRARADFKQAVSLAPPSAWSAWVTEAAQTELNKIGP
jgi:tetratricopeptide (TPR) repeat protein/predicted Ser/Thr protein kinase